MTVRANVLRTRVAHRTSADPFAAILPEVAEPKLDVSLSEEEDYSVPLRCEPTEDQAKVATNRSLRAKAKQ